MGQGCSFDYEGSPELRARIERALRWVKHPQLRVNVLDAGLVHGVQADEHCVRVSMTLASPDCHLGQELVEDVEAELLDHLGDSRRVEVQLLRKPAWTPALMKVANPDGQGPCFCQTPDTTGFYKGGGHAT